jgi:hypothetical protein
MQETEIHKPIIPYAEKLETSDDLYLAISTTERNINRAMSSRISGVT